MADEKNKGDASTTTNSVIPSNPLENFEKSCTSDVMALIYEKVNQLLGAGNQLFAMEFPARPLNAKTYEYFTDNAYSSLTKPYPIQEAEFMLSDGLYDISPIVQGSNGEKLSVVYNTILNNYVPDLKSLENFVVDKNILREWLTETVTDTIDEKETDISRMGLSSLLYNKYLEERNNWFQEKNAKYEEFKKNNALEEYAKWVSSEGMVREEKLNNMFGDAVVRGNYHEVLTMLGFLNISSPSETLESIKQNMRSSVRRSLDGSTDIYPVQFQPTDWYKSLRPNMQPKDLTMATDKLVAEYTAKQKRINSLQSELSAISVIEVSPEEQDRLANAIKQQEKLLSDSELNMVKAHGAGALSAFKSVLSIFKDDSKPAEKMNLEVVAAQQVAGTKNETPQQKNILLLLDGMGDTALADMTENFKTQQEYSAILKRLNEEKLAYSESKVKDFRTQKIRIQNQIQSLQEDLNFLQPLISGVLKINPQDDGGAATPLMTEKVEDSGNADDNSFMDVIISSEEVQELSKAKTATATQSSSVKYAGWIGSFTSEHSNLSASQSGQKYTNSEKVEIGFRVKKIAIDRGGWFNPNVFKMSNSYFHLAQMLSSKGLTKGDITAAVESGEPDALKNLVTYYYDTELETMVNKPPKESNGKANPEYEAFLKNDNIKECSYLLPAFPTGFVIAKDITIRIKHDSSTSDSSKEYMEKSDHTGGGLFGFSCNHSDASKSTNESAYFGSNSSYFYIRIPGPQILGWFLQFTPNDVSAPYQSLDPGIIKSFTEKLHKKIEEQLTPNPQST